MLTRRDAELLVIASVVTFGLTFGIIRGFMWPDDGATTTTAPSTTGAEEGGGDKDGGDKKEGNFNNVPDDNEIPFSVQFWQAFIVVRIVGFFLLTWRRVQKNKILFTFIYVVLVIINNFEIYAIPNKVADIATVATVVIAAGIYARYYAALTVLEKIIVISGVGSVFISTSVIMNTPQLNDAFDIEPQLDISPYVSGVVFFLMLADTVRTLIKVRSVTESEESFLAAQLSPVMKKKAHELDALKEQWAYLVDNSGPRDPDWAESKAEIIRMEKHMRYLEKIVAESKRGLERFNTREKNILNKYFKLDVTPTDLFKRSEEKRKVMPL
jgi:hypothetical protein